MVNYWMVAFAIMHLCFFCGAFVVFGAQYRARVAAYRAYIASVQGCAIVAGLLVVRHIIGLLYL